MEATESIVVTNRPHRSNRSVPNLPVAIQPTNMFKEFIVTITIAMLPSPAVAVSVLGLGI